jgi:hypothetical protein
MAMPVKKKSSITTLQLRTSRLSWYTSPMRPSTSGSRKSLFMPLLPVLLGGRFV